MVEFDMIPPKAVLPSAIQDRQYQAHCPLLTLTVIYQVNINFKLTSLPDCC